jgi:hypothetical protein
VKVSVNDIVIKAVALALRNVPEANGNAATLLAMIKSIVFICFRHDYEFLLQIMYQAQNLLCVNPFSVKKYRQCILVTEEGLYFQSVETYSATVPMDNGRIV